MRNMVASLSFIFTSFLAVSAFSSVMLYGRAKPAAHTVHSSADVLPEEGVEDEGGHGVHEGVPPVCSQLLSEA